MRNSLQRMSFTRAVSATLAVLASAALLLPTEMAQARPGAARSRIPPFCVMIGGSRQFSPPQICRFFDYQVCLQAAADWRGNCVVNIDYPGEISSAPGATWSRPAR